MSKQNVTRGNPGARPSNGSNGANGTKGVAPKTAGKPTMNQPVARNAARQGSGVPQQSARTARPTGARNVQPPVKRKSGFRLRPLDIALVLAGLLVIGFIVLSALQAPVQQIDANAQTPSDGTALALGSAGPDFTLPADDGNTYSLSSFKGKPVLLEFMATWCPHCQDDAPTMNQLDAAYKSKGVQILGINATPYGHDHTSTAKMDDLKWFQQTYSVTFPLLFDKTLGSANVYHVVSYPTIYILDQNGKVAFQPPTDSIPDYNTLSAALDKLLAK